MQTQASKRSRRTLQRPARLRPQAPEHARLARELVLQDGAVPAEPRPGRYGQCRALRQRDRAHVHATTLCRNIRAWQYALQWAGAGCSATAVLDPMG